MIRPMIRMAITATVLLLCATVGLAQPVGSLTPPPSDLYAGTAGVKTLRLEGAPTDDTFVVVEVRLDTVNKKVRFSWHARASGALSKFDSTEESLAFFPTAYARSWTDLAAFYVAGSIGNKAKLQKWKFDDYQLAVASDLQGRQVTHFTPPSVDRTPMLVDSTIRNLCDITVNPWPPGASGEEVWLFEWESRNVWVTDQQTGAGQIRVPAVQVSDYRTVYAYQHSIYGGVFFFQRQPWSKDLMGYDSDNDFNFKVLHDQNLDGSQEGSWLIPFEDQDTHPLYTSGTFSFPWMGDT